MPGLISEPSTRTHEFTIPFVPITLNRLMGMNRLWRGSHKRRETNAIVYAAARSGVPKAEGKRRVTQRITLVGRDRERDDDGAWKVLLDALTTAGMLIDDKRQWVEKTPLEFERGTVRQTVITLEDLYP